ncbi:MAG: ATPase [Bacteroidetes bacterium]|nr:MAG: ATPase [Bacteroidota bacterium]
MPRDYKKYFRIPASPELVYAALTTEATLRLWTGEEAEFTAEPNTKFSLWDGSIVGKNLEFEPGKTIVQQWYFGEREEESIVTLKVHPDKEFTSLEIRHTNIPDEDYEEMCDGWEDVFVAALVDFYTE